MWKKYKRQYKNKKITLTALRKKAKEIKSLGFRLTKSSIDADLSKIALDREFEKQGLGGEIKTATASTRIELIKRNQEKEKKENETETESSDASVDGMKNTTDYLLGIVVSFIFDGFSDESGLGLRDNSMAQEYTLSLSSLSNFDNNR